MTRVKLYGDWRRKAGKRRTHLYRDDRPVCGARVTRHLTVRDQRAELRDVCYECLVFAASGR